MSVEWDLGGKVVSFQPQWEQKESATEEEKHTNTPKKPQKQTRYITMENTDRSAFWRRCRRQVPLNETRQTITVTHCNCHAGGQSKNNNTENVIII